ncbi:MAG: hypothetical protein GY810_32800 [Aureispira sp.]|nr:hypothetical protein [Aureispira sp.]
MDEELKSIEDLAKELSDANKETIDPLLDVLESENIGEGNKAFWSIFSIGSTFALFMGMIALNGIIGVILLIKLLFSGMILSSTTLLVVGALLIGLPATYLFIGYRYSTRKVIWEVYNNVLKKLLQKLTTMLVSKLAQNLGVGSKKGKKNQVVQTIKSYIESIMNRIPKMFHKYLSIATIATQTVDGVYEMKSSGELTNPSMIERCANMVFNKMDQQLEGQLKPSLTPFFVVLGINIIIGMAIWSML